ncbi:hypothetical protein D9611_008457 [Ephemerocybe angulata]|uniref:JmjC domain-containing protein n=1 Tax=Ephemerocybe angulata TaxID=980116 RepID=A0A8H5BII6_9AGAR|nr:hypothetical protein D9611_008457 [Tulosesus angulatus]
MTSLISTGANASTRRVAVLKIWRPGRNSAAWSWGDTSAANPLHIAKPELSAFRRFTREEWDKATREEKREPYPRPRQFTREGIEEYTSITAVRVLHDFSRKAQPDMEGNDIHVSGTLEQLIAEHEKGDAGDILNALDLALDSEVKRDALYLDVEAYFETMHVKLPAFALDYPDARHDGHIDSDGTATWVQPVVGEEKFWAVATPRRRQKNCKAGYLLGANNDVRTWMELDPGNPTAPAAGEEQSRRKNGESELVWEGVVARGGDIVIMPPDTLHAVQTLGSTFCRGGHFYCSSTLALTAASLVHSFLMENFITNTRHLRLTPVWLRIAIYYHDRIVVKGDELNNVRGVDMATDWDDFHGFVMLHVVVVLVFALDPRSYGDSEGEMTRDDVLLLLQARGAAMSTMLFLEDVRVRQSRMDEVKDVLQYFEAMLVEQAINLVKCTDALREDALERKPKGQAEPAWPGCATSRPGAVVTQLRDALSYKSGLERVFLDGIGRGKKRTVDTEKPIAIVPLPPADGDVKYRSAKGKEKHVAQPHTTTPLYLITFAKTPLTEKLLNSLSC